jgi:hypothetical protein
MTAQNADLIPTSLDKIFAMSAAGLRAGETAGHICHGFDAGMFSQCGYWRQVNRVN